MKNQKFSSIIIACFLISVVFFSTACDSSFYLTEKEFYALRSQIATEAVANQVFSNMQNGQLQITFDNSVSPPRVQSSNLETFMRTHIPSLGILEGFPSNALQINRVSGEIEKQFDNWLANQLRLYAGANNAQARLERVEQMRIRFMNNPTFVYSENKIVFNTTLQMTVDCRIRIDALDPIMNFIFGANGIYDVSVTAENLQIQGELSFNSIAQDSSNLQFKLTPSVGNVTVTDRGIVTPQAVKTGIEKVIKTSLKAKVEESFQHKYDYFNLSNCRISGEFGCEYDARPVSQNAELHAVARGTDNKLYAAIRRNDVWSNYTQICCTSSQLQVNFTSDPSLAVSGSGTIELAAMTTGGEVFYAQYQNGWKNFRFVLPVIPPGTPAAAAQSLRYAGKPTIVATAPGQVEIFVTRVNGTIAHLRRVNGNWTAPVSVNLPSSIGIFPNVTLVTYRDPIAVLSGNKIFLAAASSTNRIYAKLYDMETGLWGLSSLITMAENMNFAPSAASSGDGRIDIAYVGQSGNVFHRPLNVSANNITQANASLANFTLLPETTIWANVNAAPIIVASGYRRLGLIARGTDYRLYYSHFAGTHSPTGLIDGRNVLQGWNGWIELNGNFYGTRLWSNEYNQEFAASATKSGKLDVVSRLPADILRSAYTLHHNGYDASDYGRQPWKTVHWRGYNLIGSRQFSGRPALAALDGNFEVAMVGQGFNIYNAQQGTNFEQHVGFQNLSNPVTVDPVAVASGKGLVDLIAVASDRKLNSIRFSNRYGRTLRLPGQTSLTFQSRPAVVTGGDGQLDVVGVSTTGSIYHWRHVSGVWFPPQQIPGTVASSPILVNTGAGQLELFAVGGDNKVYRWRFLGGAWGNWQQLPGAFATNASQFGQGSAITWGDGTVDLAVVSNAIVPAIGGSIYHRHVEPRDDTIALPNLPAQTFSLLAGRGGDQPFIGAFNRREKFVIVKDNLNPRFSYNWLDASGVWQSSQMPTGNLSLRIGGLAQHSTGATAMGADGNGKIYFHNRLAAASPRFDFTPLIEQTTQSQMRFFRPTIASYGGQY